MPRFTKKPVTIEAHRWFENGDHPEDHDPIGKDNPTSIDLMRYDEYLQSEGQVVRRYRHPDKNAKDTCPHCNNVMQYHGWIDTLEGGHVACPGDWIITGVKGEKYPCKPDVFEETYTPTEAVIG